MPDGAATLDLPTGTADRDDLQAWVRDATARFSWLKTVSASNEVNKAARMFAKPSGNGRARGRIALERALAPVAFLEARGDIGRLPFLCWAVIRPRPETSSVSLSFVAVIRFESGRVTIVSLFWSADVQLSALADALRHGETDPDGLLLQAHRALLDAPAGAADVAAEIAVPAGGGYFIGRFGRSAAGNEPYVIFQAHRWVPGLDAGAAEPIGVAADGEARMADFHLDPLRLASAQFA